jgi:hypothetical protein
LRSFGRRLEFAANSALQAGFCSDIGVISS